MRSPASSPTPSCTPNTSYRQFLISELRKQWHARLRRLRIRLVLPDRRSMKKPISVVTKVIKHNPEFCRLVTIPLDVVAPWKLNGTTTVEGTINGADLGRRSLKRWDERN